MARSKDPLRRKNLVPFDRSVLYREGGMAEYDESRECLDAQSKNESDPSDTSSGREGG